MVVAADTQEALRPGTTTPGSVEWSALGSPDELAQATKIIADPGAALRTSTPEDSMRRVEPYLSDYGITRVAHLTFLDRVGIPVHTAHKPAGKSLSNGSGKGVTPQASRIGAMMEAIEQTYWEDTLITRILASEEELQADGIPHVAPQDLPMNRGNLWNSRLQIQWTPMTDVSDGAQVLAPADIVGLPWKVGAKRISHTHMCSSNGLASGNNVVEAVLSGLTEVMERDAVAMTAAASTELFPAHSLDLDVLRQRCGDPFVGLVDKLERAGLTLTVYDETGDIGLPTYKCRVTESSGGGAGSFGGYGASLDANTALVRAVTEAAQSRVLLIAGARDDHFRCGRDASQLMSRQYQSAPSIADIQPIVREDLSTGTLCSDVELLTGILRDKGMPQVLFHRYTSVGDPVQVVRVLVPRLEGYMFANYLPGKRAAAVIAARTASSG